MPLTEISGNEKKISDAIGEIQSNQKYTDMKGALTEIKLTLDERTDKRRPLLIFLTDGALTLDDIHRNQLLKTQERPTGKTRKIKRG